MKKSKEKSTNNLMLLRVTLLLMVQHTVCRFPNANLRINSQSDILLSPCNSHPDAERIAIQLREANPTRYQQYQINAIYFKPQAIGQLPNCFQTAFTTPIPDTRYFTYDSSSNFGFFATIEDNSLGSINYGESFSKISSIQAITETELSADLWNLGIGQGNILLLFSVQDTSSNFYYFLSFGGWTGVYDPTCGTCSGMGNNECTSCSPISSLVGQNVDNSLSGRCFCPEGQNKYRRPIECQNTCGGECKSCISNSAAECLECKDGSEMSTRDGNGVGECVRLSNCHETCETCSGINEDDCLTCKNISPAHSH